MDKNKKAQITDTIFMVRPYRFGANPQTLGDNYFQDASKETADANELATAEFDAFVKQLRAHDINVIVVQDTPVPHTPDSIFPNNWFLTDDEGTLTLFKMYAPNRDAESHKPHLYDALIAAYQPKRIRDLRPLSAEMGEVLEGTGSMIIDRTNGIIYACRSNRMSERLLDNVCEHYGFSSVVFDALDKNGQQIYHTNVMMALAEELAVICTECIPLEQRMAVISSLEETGHDICDITLDQVYQYAGNMLSVKNNQGKHFMVMSQRALKSLTPRQIQMIEAKMKILAPELEVIENLGGGSARCMMGEIYRTL